MRINANKFTFGINEIEYLGYVVTTEGIKPDPKKIQAIMDLGRPRTTTEVRKLLGIVQYYRDLWARRSHILGPLTDLAGGAERKENRVDRGIGGILHQPEKWSPKRRFWHIQTGANRS